MARPASLARLLWVPLLLAACRAPALTYTYDVPTCELVPAELARIERFAVVDESALRQPPEALFQFGRRLAEATGAELVMESAPWWLSKDDPRSGDEERELRYARTLEVDGLAFVEVENTRGAFAVRAELRAYPAGTVVWRARSEALMHSGASAPALGAEVELLQRVASTAGARPVTEPEDTTLRGRSPASALAEAGAFCASWAASMFAGH